MSQSVADGMEESTNWEKRAAVRSMFVKRYVGLSRCRSVSLVCLVLDEIDKTDQRDQIDERRDTSYE